MHKTLVQFLGQEDSLEKRWATHSSIHGLHWWFTGKRICLQCGRPGFPPWVGQIPWRWVWQPSAIFLPGESPWTGMPGGLQSMGLQRVRLDWATKHTLDDLFPELACCFEKPRLPWRGKWGRGRKVYSSSLWLLWRLALRSSLEGIWLGRLVVVTEGSGSRNEAVNELVSGWNGAALLSWGMGTPRDWVSPACSVEAKHVTSVHLFPLL